MRSDSARRTSSATPRITPRLPPARRKAPSSSRRVARKVICTASVEDRVPPFLRNTGQGLGHGRVRHAAARHEHAHDARGQHGQGRRPDAGDPAADRPLAALGDQHAGTRRTDDLDRLRRHPGGRRHAHGVDHRRLRRPRARAREDCASATCCARFRSPTTSPPSASASSTANRCSISRTKTTRRADVDMNIVKTGDGRFIEVQGTAEAMPFGRDALNTLLDLADHGIRAAHRKAARDRRPPHQGQIIWNRQQMLK